MKRRKMVSILIIAVVAILMLTTAVASAQTVSAASKVKVTWDANGGKIGTSKTTITNVKKGTKIGILPKTPKKTGYVFYGWYTKKSGGTKITTTTHVKKKVTYYAQWKKASSKILNAEEKKLVGTWWRTNPYNIYQMDTYGFRADGTFSFTYGSSYIRNGNYKVSGGKISFTNVITSKVTDELKDKYPNTVAEYRFEKRSDGKGDYLNIAALYYPDRNNLPLSFVWDRWYKS